jgi:hypothetical protein
MMRTRTYSEMARYETFEERFDYLMLGGSAGVATFGFDRYLNQMFYTSREWKDVRRYVIIRDEGCDLGVPGFEIHSNLLIHHINPMVPDDIRHGETWILDPEYLITTSHNTHNAIHYGDKRSLPKPFVERSPNDTKLW